PRRKTFSILIVDDDVDVAENLKILLELRGHNIVIVDDGMRCITHCKDRERHYDIVFMDYHMEGLDGAQVTDIVKSDEKKTLIFAYTGDSSQKAIDDFKQVGMDGAIIKPIDVMSIEMLMTRLEHACILDQSVIKNITRKSSNSILFFEETLTIC
ncbi:MAG: hybrid sensor histidine kinase/response regulator, partial [Harvfovirus sp.]